MPSQPENHTKLLQHIYKLSRGNVNEIISRKHLGDQLGLSSDETKEALAVLTDQGMIRYILFNALCITHMGVAEAESMITKEKDAGPSEEHRITVLFLAADPTDGSRRRLGEELREIGEKLQLSRLRERFELEQRLSVRPADLTQAMLDLQPAVVHFSGHGTQTGALCIENEVGLIHEVSSDALGALFEQFADKVECVVLNACYSETQAHVIAKHIPYVIGMNQAIGDRAAIAFAIGFYQALGAGRTIEDAYELGCIQIRLQGEPEHAAPVLLKRGQRHTAP